MKIETIPDEWPNVLKRRRSFPPDQAHDIGRSGMIAAAPLPPSAQEYCWLDEVPNGWIHADHCFEIFFKTFHALDLKTYVIEAWTSVFRLGIVFNFPRSENQSHFTVGKIEVWIFQSFFFFFKLEYVRIESRHRLRVDATNCYVLDIAILLARRFAPNASKILRSRLRQVE
jgi:hypothetical protein